MRATASNRSLGIAAASTIVEWYDFTLFLYLAPTLSHIFFGDGPQSRREMFAMFAISYFARPLGATVFGYLGDRYGRRRAMLMSMTLMSVAMLAMALIPTHTDSLRYAANLMLFLRCLMSFSVGGEYNAVVVYMTEGAPRERRGFVTSLACGASQIGGLAATGMAAIVVHSLSPDQLDVWGFRIPFFVGAALAFATLLARSSMDESPAFAQNKADEKGSGHPLGRALSEGKIAMLQGFAISALGSVTYYVGMTYVPSFLAESHAASQTVALWLSTVAALVAVVATPGVGWLTDRFGRRPILRGVCAAAVLLPVPLFSRLGEGAMGGMVTATLTLAALGACVSAVGAVTTAELFPSGHRLSGLALGVSSATVLFGGLAPYVTQLLLERYAWPGIPGLMIALVALAALPVVLFVPETRPSAANPVTSPAQKS